MAGYFGIKRETLAKFLPDHKTIKQFESLFSLVNEIGVDSVQFIAEEATITEDKVLCSGDGYDVTMPIGPITGRSVTVFNTSDYGYITLLMVEGEAFKLYAGETLDMIYSGTEWQA